MIVAKDKDGDICLIANYSIQYPYLMEGMKYLDCLEVPMQLQRLRSRTKKLKDIIKHQEDITEDIMIDVTKRRKLITFLKSIQRKFKKGIK